MSGKGWEVEEGRFKREGTDVSLCLIHAGIWQKPTQHCKAVILQLKINVKKQGVSFLLSVTASLILVDVMG